MRKTLIFISLLLFLAASCAFSAVHGLRQYLHESDAWFTAAKAREVADNILSHQSTLGGRPKNIDTTAG